MPQLLLELFSEEIPARMQAGAARDLERMATERLKAAGLTFEALTTFAGPRRLTLVVEGLPAATPDREEEIKGPKTSAPEQALEGFLRKTGLAREQLVERDGVLFAVVSEKGRATATLIPEMVERIVRDFPWPKSMRWGPRSPDSGSLRWVRPLKRIVCLFDGAVVPFDIDGIASGDMTEGHRFMGSGQPFAVKDFADYRAKLERDHVLLDASDRRLKILEAARAVCQARGLELVDDDGLLDEVAGLAEWPTPILGEMDPAFLDLPPEVVRLSMKVHQKYFAVSLPSQSGGSTAEGGEGGGRAQRLAPNFVVVANVAASDGGTALAAGNARVLSARLNDARFFWDEDRKVGFDVWAKKLEGVTFHAKLGTLAERVERIAALAREIAPLVGADADQAEQAARLAKADLASGMVGEFPELQGVMGGYYARLAPTPALQADPPHKGEGDGADLPPLDGEGGREADGWGDAVADAIRDHYKPQGPNDAVPTAPLTVAVALADKLDTLVGFFAIDEKPTGSKDPFALRRAALGVIRLVLENGVRAPMGSVSIYATSRAAEAADRLARSDDQWVRIMADLHGSVRTNLAGRLEKVLKGWNPYPDDGGSAHYAAVVQVQNVVADLLAFFADRLKVLLRDQGQRHDLVDAVFALGDDDLVRIVRRVEALGAFLETEDGENLLAGYKRASNILRAEAKKGPLPEGEPVALDGAPPEETALIAAVSKAGTEVDAALATEDFAAAMTALSHLRAPVDAFFTAVMVNSDVPAERDTRLKLLGQVRTVMGRVADFGKVGGRAFSPRGRRWLAERDG
ncbi:glycine--tRNA ligase subunit beta [Brevundimonas halotolerans]|uniref:Glycine--tRNA ligase beta subunit n=1 Tax=Brevundimonas halotolerans TaxID=69670 RepID=A0A7W9E5Y8_9CAUL|nr:glycine--tRNA ligase subunit beta [Brevundimonas halotolerans]MBB5659842.1 glycyl-tRNA synthetase beta chain [Brevundimonas halotolerans]